MNILEKEFYDIHINVNYKRRKKRKKENQKTIYLCESNY